MDFDISVSRWNKEHNAAYSGLMSAGLIVRCSETGISYAAGDEPMPETFSWETFCGYYNDYTRKQIEEQKYNRRINQFV